VGISRPERSFKCRAHFNKRQKSIRPSPILHCFLLFHNHNPTFCQTDTYECINQKLIFKKNSNGKESLESEASSVLLVPCSIFIHHIPVLHSLMQCENFLKIVMLLRKPRCSSKLNLTCYCCMLLHNILFTHSIKKQNWGTQQY
jgi:hypothetical protein